MTRMQRGARSAAVAVFLILVFVVVPLAIAEAHRTDLYYTLSSVALLSIASGGVWLTFYIGRINIGQGAYALVGAETADLPTLFDREDGKPRRLEQAVDAIKSRHGDEAVKMGRVVP